MTNPLRYIARIVIEFKTPFLISKGEDDCLADSVFVTDMNGLPTLPGSSITGALKSKFKKINEKTNESKINNIFGFQDKDDGEGSRLTISWGCIHDEDNKPVESIIDRAELLKDEVLCNALDGFTRDHVRINHRGTADKEEHGKFDERCVPAGHRFTFEMMLEGNKNDKKDWESLLNIIAADSMKLGGKTRRGLGAFEVIKLQEGVYDLKTEDGFKGFSNHPVELSKETDMPDKRDPYKGIQLGTDIALTLELEPQGFWMIGGGISEEDIDISPVRMSKIIWNKVNKGSVGEKEIYLPGTAFKGPLSHRVAYYYNALNGKFADKIPIEEFKNYVGSCNHAVLELFGYAKAKEATGKPGRIFIDDLYLTDKLETKTLNHVSIDRFTGGARSGALFSESPVYKGPKIQLKIIISEYDKITDANIKKALNNALLDLAEGRLSIGSGAGRGNGFFTDAKFKGLEEAQNDRKN